MIKALRSLMVMTAVSLSAAVSTMAAEQTAVFAGGCFWGVEAVFDHVRGVTSAVSGYAGGTKETANYETVVTGKTDHAESVMIRFDPSTISYKQLLEVFFSVAHDPTQLNHQGPDHGRQYRSVIFYTTDEQRGESAAFITKLRSLAGPRTNVVTQLEPLQEFYKAEHEHQDFVKLNPTVPYVAYYDLPKLKELKKRFPALYMK
jgi:peptide-methionine (S)-S-oxide reductase